MRIRKRVRRVIIGCVTVAIVAAGTWAMSVIPGAVTGWLDSAGGAILPAEPGPEYGESAAAVLERVVDGDTIVISEDGASPRVRIIGIDTPELGRGAAADECYAQEATVALTAALGAGPLELVSDPSQGDTDKYGRLLRHVYVNGQSVAAKMLAEGMGHEYTYSAPYAGQAEHLAAQSAAQANGVGLWSACQ